MRTFLIATLALISLGLLGCVDGPVGQYRVDEVELREASCTGIDQTRGAAWATAMRESPITEMLVGEEEGVAGGPPRVQYLREDSSIFSVQLPEETITEAGNHSFSAERLDDAIGVRDAGLGADFSTLLEADAVGCQIEYRLTLELEFRDGGWDAAISDLLVEVGQPFSSDNSCIVERCSALYEVAAAHTSGIDPGLRGND